MNKIKSDEKGKYTINPTGIADNEIIRHALNILGARMASGPVLDSPETTRNYLALQHADKPAEVFGILFLNNRHGVIEYKELFQGTIDGCSVHPREVIRACIEVNAAAVILSHNHPSGNPDPSRADIQITKRLNDALALIDVRVLDHIVTGGSATVSFAERGLI